MMMVSWEGRTLSTKGPAQAKVDRLHHPQLPLREPQCRRQPAQLPLRHSTRSTKR